MKNTILLLAFFFTFTSIAFGRSFNFQLINKTTIDLQIFYQIVQTTEKDNPEFVFNLTPNSKKTVPLKIKKGEKIKITGFGSGIETLPIVKSFENLDGDLIVLELLLPKVEKINIVELNDALSKIKNDNFLKILLDSSRYSKDELPILGTFVFYNLKNNTAIHLSPTFWKNSSDIRSVNNQYFETIDYVNSSNSAGLNLSGVPFLKKLGSSFANTNLLEINWKVTNAHIEQWQPTTKNAFDIMQDPISKPFIEACVYEMSSKNLSGGEYSLFFISSALVVDNIVVSAKKYNKVVIDVDANFQVPGPDMEVVKPIGVEANYGYSREKLYSNVDSSANLYLKFLAQDYTLLLNSYINQTAKDAQKNSAIKNLEKIKSAIIEQYKILQEIDSGLIRTDQIEVILPILEITSLIDLTLEQFDSLGVNTTPQSDKEYNKKANQFNAILKSSKDLILQYKSTVESIEKLNQPTDYYKVVNSITSIEVDKKIIEAFIKSNN